MNTMIRRLNIVSGIVITLNTSIATSATISFNEYAFGTTIDDKYTNVGAFFSVSGGNPAVIYDLTGDAGLVDGLTVSTPLLSPPNGLRIIDPPAWDDRLLVTFVDPTDQVSPAFVTSVSFSYVSDVAGMGSIQAIDSSNSVIDFASSTLGGPSGDQFQEYETISVTGSQIWRIEIDGFADVAIDELTFDTPKVIPIPAAVWLFGSGLIGLLRISKYLS